GLVASIFAPVGGPRAHTGAVFTLAVSPDGMLLASGDGHGVVKLWDIPSQPGRLVKERATLQAHTGETSRLCGVYGLAFTPDGTGLASAGADGVIGFWDVAAGRERASYQWRQGWVTSVAFAPDGMTAAAGNSQGTIVVWDIDGAL